MAKPPSRGRIAKVLNGVVSNGTSRYSKPIDDFIFFNNVIVYLNNQDTGETVDYLIQGTMSLADTTNAEWQDIVAQVTLATAARIIITYSDAPDLDACWDAIRIGYVQSDSGNQGILHAWIGRK